MKAQLVVDDEMGAFDRRVLDGTVHPFDFLAAFALRIVDEIGCLPVVSSGGNLFFQFFDARYERDATVLTSNRGFAE